MLLILSVTVAFVLLLLVVFAIVRLRTARRITWMREKALKGIRSAKKMARGMQLLPAVVLAIAGGVAVTGLSMWALRAVVGSTRKPSDPIDITKLALAIAAGVGGVVGLVVAYRRQRDLETSRFIDRFGAAAAQLGAQDPAVRLAGVYAMAGVADESNGLRRQQCVDVLCGYLRMQYLPELDKGQRTKRVERTKRYNNSEVEIGETEDTYEPRKGDGEVRRTIVRVITSRLTKEAENGWWACTFDFREAVFESPSFADCLFMGNVLFDYSRFVGTATFNRSNFRGNTSFRWVTFANGVYFIGTEFNSVRFMKAEFSGPTEMKVEFRGPSDFSESRWGACKFDGSNFHGETRFDGASFVNADMRRVSFLMPALFRGVRFTGSTQFHTSTSRHLIDFSRSKFKGPVMFGKSEFRGRAIFDLVKFENSVYMKHSAFKDGKVTFKYVRFRGAAYFAHALFDNCRTSFDGAHFRSAAEFTYARFEGGLTSFDGVLFGDHAIFADVRFLGETVFRQVGFSGSRTDFRRVDFGSQQILFDSPVAWGPPEPEFDWNHPLSRRDRAKIANGEELSVLPPQPLNVLPSEWPPIVSEGDSIEPGE